VSTITGPKAPADPFALEEEPIDYGYRFVTRTLADGREITEQVPLTREDVLHPQEGDAIMQNDPHDEDRIYLKNVFKCATVDDPTARVFADLGVDLNLPGVAPFCPDITVVFGVHADRLWSMYDVGEFGITPWLFVEITSPSTRADDLTTKVNAYHRGKVPLFIIADSVIRGGERLMRMIGYRDTPEGYAEWLPDERGWFWLDRLRLWLGIARGRVVCYDVHGQEIGNYVAISQSLAAAEARAHEEAQARAAAEQRLRELEEKLRRLEQAGGAKQP